MTRARGTRVFELFVGAQGLPPLDRKGFLKSACGSDQALRREVESLLHYDGAVGSFLGVFSTVGGKTLGHYQVLEPIGEAEWVSCTRPAT